MRKNDSVVRHPTQEIALLL